MSKITNDGSIDYLRLSPYLHQLHASDEFAVQKTSQAEASPVTLV